MKIALAWLRDERSNWFFVTIICTGIFVIGFEVGRLT